MTSVAELLLLTSLPFAQNPPEGMGVRELLASSDSAQLAWGAELAARKGQAEYVPDLRRLLAWTDDRVKEQALDALIRLKAKVPSEELTPLPEVFRDQVIILAITNGNRDILASLLAENPDHDATWVALNEGILAFGAGRTYWPKLLREWTIHVVIYVTDPGRTAILGPGSGGGICGDSIAQPRPGFPPRASYGLFLDPQPGDAVLCFRPHPVYYRRHLSASGCDTRTDRDDYRADFVALSVRVSPPIKGHLRYDLAWTSVDAYVAEIDRLRRDLLGRYQQILDVTVQRRLVPPEDGVLRPRIVVGFEDQRSNKSHDLPPTPPWE